MNKFEMEIKMSNDLEVLYTTIPEITDINYILEELSHEEEFDLNDITEIKVYELKN
tara:strand:+ start:168 stop:335 length:168 start_codon:yes stop_codon:yes gene_type:complete